MVDPQTPIRYARVRNNDFVEEKSGDTRWVLLVGPLKIVPVSLPLRSRCDHQPRAGAVGKASCLTQALLAA